MNASIASSGEEVTSLHTEIVSDGGCGRSIAPSVGSEVVTSNVRSSPFISKNGRRFEPLRLLKNFLSMQARNLKGKTQSTRKRTERKWRRGH